MQIRLLLINSHNKYFSILISSLVFDEKHLYEMLYFIKG